MKALKVIGFIFLSLLLWALGFLAISLIVEDVDKIGVIVILYSIVGIISIVFATKWFIKNGYRLNLQDTHLSKHGESAAKLAEAQFLSEKLNKSSVDVSSFCSDYNALCDCLDRLIWLNEKRHVSMDPKPRATKERIASNLPATVNEFIDRSVAEINSESGYIYVVKWLCDLRINDDFTSMLSKNVERHITQLQHSYTGTTEDHISNHINECDELLPQAVDIIFYTKQASASMIQRRLNLGYSRAASIVDQIEELGIISPFNGSAPRSILISKEQWESIKHDLITQPLGISDLDSINTAQIIQDENDWRKAQFASSPVDYELYRIDHMEGHAFEHWCADILKKNGFENVEVTQASNDQGVDVLAEKDGIKYAVQCKCYSSDLGNTPIQEVNAGKAIYHCHVGAVMTNRYFTAGAKEAAKANNILLWDRDYIAELLKNNS